jgi:hypothetical protein
MTHPAGAPGSLKPSPLHQVLAAQENDGNKVVKEQILGPRAKQVGR